jgi:hypothetical protein
MVSWISQRTVRYADAGRVTRQRLVRSSTVRCRRSTCSLLWEVYGNVRTCLTLWAAQSASKAPRNSVPLSVWILLGFPNSCNIFSWTASATVVLLLSLIRVKTQNLLKQQIALRMGTVSFPSPRLTIKSNNHSQRGPGGIGRSCPCQDPCDFPRVN